MTMQQAYVLVVLVALVLCKQHTILNRMVKAAQLMLGGFLVIVLLLIYKEEYNKYIFIRVLNYKILYIIRKLKLQYEIEHSVNP